MQPENYYPQRLEALQQQLNILLRKKSLLGWLRFASVAAIGGVIYFLWSYGWLYVTIPSVILLIVFTRLLFADLNNKAVIRHTYQLINITNDEVKALAHNYFHFEDGLEFLPKEHLYANDLDIFGRASLFQYINRTGSEMGGAVLAGWLLQPASPEMILQRQTAVKELTQKTEWRQALLAFGREKKIKQATANRLDQWLNEPDHFSSFKSWSWLRYLIPLVILGVVILNIFDVIPHQVRNIVLLLSAAMAYMVAKKVAPVHEQLSKIVDEMDILYESIHLIEGISFQSELLLQLQSGFRQNNGKASAELKKLKKILERFDLRYNPVVFVPLTILLQWDLQQVLKLEKWKQRNHKNVTSWFEALGQFEALNSFSTLAFNHPEYCYPVLKEEHFFMEGENIGHPLINKNKRVDNSISIHHKAELMLVTGSNMAGKSTYLRSIGINTVLAMAGAPVCAESFSLSPVQIISSMRIADNLEESTSTFYAELKKLKTVIDHVNRGAKVFILLDEILRGTNSLDRHTGSVALIKQLIKHKAAAIIATHDVELAKLKENYPANILNFHFDVQVSNDELYFDYELKPGVCTSLNASILMKKIGIEL
ncbi:MAG: hypothetical protein ABJA78_20235 [Ferruginibacter sp.]